MAGLAQPKHQRFDPVTSLVYTIDLSAASDLLWADIFTSTYQVRASQALLFALNDFQLDRSFQVKFRDYTSSTKYLDRGCDQRAKETE